MGSLRVLDGEAVRRLLSIETCIEAMSSAMSAVSCGVVSTPERQFEPLIDQSGVLAMMQGSTLTPPVFGAKLINILPGNPALGRVAIQGVVVLFDHQSGAPIAILDGAAITEIRTAAASGLATSLLSREDARSHGILGTGVQARSHIDAVLAVRPGIEEIKIWGRSHEKASLLSAQTARETGRRVFAVASAQEAASCDIVSTVTASPEPVVKGAWLRPGAHLNIVGSHSPEKREVDTEAVCRSLVFCDVLDSAMKEAGDLLIPIREGAFARERICGEIGEVVLGRVSGRKDQSMITLYKSLGTFAQDLYAAWSALVLAEARCEGTLLDW